MLQVINTWSKRTITHQGHEIKYEAKPFTTTEFMKIMPVLPKSKEAATKMTAQETMAMVDVIPTILPAAVQNLEGICDQNKKDLTIQEVCENSATMQLMMDIATDVIGMTQLGASEAKNS